MLSAPPPLAVSPHKTDTAAARTRAREQRISVIVPTYNRAQYIVEAIAAIEAQTYPVLEIIVVDDGSTDGTGARVAALAGRIKYIQQQNSGKAAALNHGLRHCSGDYVWICDDDDLALPHAAECLVAALTADPSAGFAFGRFKRFAIDSQTGERRTSDPVYWPALETNSLLVNLLEDCFIFQNACLIRKQALDTLGPFRTDLLRSQDYEMTVRLALHFNAASVPDVIFLQRAHEGQRGSELDRFDSAEQLKKWLHYDRLFFAPLYETIPLDKYAPTSLASEGDAALRAALLQRACIFWRKKFFTLSLADMASAVEMTAIGPLTDTEKSICGRFLLSKFGCDELAQPELVDQLNKLATQSPLGQTVVKIITAPLLWYIRTALARGDWKSARGWTTTLLRFHSGCGLASLVMKSMARRLQAAPRGYGAPPSAPIL
jgi:glycosyltransferase involved in cell wall biosynthesis